MPPLEICLHFPCHPSRPKRRSLRCLSSPVSHNVSPPTSESGHLANFSQYELLICDTRNYSISLLSLCPTIPLLLLTEFVSEWERGKKKKPAGVSPHTPRLTRVVMGHTGSNVSWKNVRVVTAKSALRLNFSPVPSRAEPNRAGSSTNYC